MESVVRAIIAGGRNLLLTARHYDWLTAIHAIDPITEVVCGCCTGADDGGRLWALNRSIPVKEFPAKWDELGDSAGPIRNQQMARYVAEGLTSGVCILFPGGKGTANMRKTAKRFRIHTIIYPGD